MRSRSSGWFRSKGCDGARGASTAFVGVLVAVSGTQSRSGMIAAGVAITVAWLMTWNRRQMVAAMITPVVLVLALAWAINFQVPATPRPISVTQLVKNVASLTGGGSSELSDTAQWHDVPSGPRC